MLGDRPLPSCLAGGDLDGYIFNTLFELRSLSDCSDTFDICLYAEMKPKKFPLPAAYPGVRPETLPYGQQSDIDDIIDFVVEYIHSDVLGLLSTNHSVIAGSSSLPSVFGTPCNGFALQISPRSHKRHSLPRLALTVFV